MVSAEGAAAVQALSSEPEKRAESRGSSFIAGSLWSSNSSILGALVDDDVKTKAANDDAKTKAANVDAISLASLTASSTASFPDLRGFSNYVVADEHTRVVYEAYAFTKYDGVEDCYTWKSFCGLRFGKIWHLTKNGYLVRQAEMAYDQDELSDMHAAAIRTFDEAERMAGGKGKKTKKTKGNKADDNDKDGAAYAQDLADRVYRLPYDVYHSVAELVTSKTWATDMNPSRKREWRVVVLEEVSA